MYAVRFHETGGPEVLQYESVPTPEPGPGQVRLRVAGAAFNAADGGMRGGFLPIPIELPHVPGYDVAGTVDSLGAGVEGLGLGDQVIGLLPMDADGGDAQYVIAPAEALVSAPTSIPLSQAAGVPSVGLTAWQAVHELGQLSSGQRIAINGAGGSVGNYAVQLAKRAGAHVIATASPRSKEKVLAGGADQVVDHTSESLADALGEPVDVLLNLAPISEEDFTDLATHVRDGGVVVSTTPMVATPSDEARSVRGETVFVRADVDTLKRLVSLLDDGTVTAEPARLVPLEDLKLIHEEAESGSLSGKVVVVPPED